MSNLKYERLKRVRKVLEDIEKKKKDIANEIGVTPSYVTMLMKDDSINPSDTFLKTISRTYGYNYLWLNEGKGPEKTAEDFVANMVRSIIPDNEFAVKTISAASSMPLEWWQSFEKLAQQFLEEFQKNQTTEEPEE